jgi:hypothetical protein
MEMRDSKSIFFFNAILAILAGMVAIGISPNGEDLIRFALFPITTILIIQELFLMQYAFKEENMDFTRRIHSHLFNLTPSSMWKGKLLVVTSIIAISLLISVYLIISGIQFTTMIVIRTLLLSISLTLILDPLIGLLDKGGIDIAIGCFTYIVLIIFGYSGLNNILVILNTSEYWYLAALGIALFTFFILRLRWAYYKLFCYEDEDHLLMLVISVVIPITILILPMVPEHLYNLLNLIRGD